MSPSAASSQNRGGEAPQRECFIFEDRVYTYEAVNRRIDNIVLGLVDNGVRPAMHVGVLMNVRPSAMAAVAAVSRLGAVSVLIPPGPDAAAAARLGGVEKLVSDPENLDLAIGTGLPVLVLGGGDVRDLDVEPGADVVDLERTDISGVHLPGWYVPDPGLARELAFVLFVGSGPTLETKRITNYRWALSAFGTATAASLGRRDTMYCLAPLHHSSGLLVSFGGALAGGARIALSNGLDPAKFGEEVHRYGVTVVTYTWSMMREVLDSPSLHIDASHPIRLFIGSGMPPGLWWRTLERFAPARVLEFYASTEGDVILANVVGFESGIQGTSAPRQRCASVSRPTTRSPDGSSKTIAASYARAPTARSDFSSASPVRPTKRSATSCAVCSNRVTCGSPPKTCSAVTRTVTTGFSTTNAGWSSPRTDRCTRSR